VADGGRTSATNSQGLREACNHAKEGLGWRARTVGGGVETITPTGQRHLSRPPPVIGAPPPYTFRPDTYSDTRIQLIA
jgi:hypothetical protein